MAVVVVFHRPIGGGPAGWMGVRGGRVEEAGGGRGGVGTGHCWVLVRVAVLDWANERVLVRLGVVVVGEWGLLVAEWIDSGGFAESGMPLVHGASHLWFWGGDGVVVVRLLVMRLRVRVGDGIGVVRVLDHAAVGRNRFDLFFFLVGGGHTGVGCFGF